MWCVWRRNGAFGAATQRAAGAKNWRRELFLAPRLVGARFWRQTDNLVPKMIVLAPESLFGVAFLASRQILAPGFGVKSWRRKFFCFWRRWFLASNLGVVFAFGAALLLASICLRWATKPTAPFQESCQALHIASQWEASLSGHRTHK